MASQSSPRLPFRLDARVGSPSPTVAVFRILPRKHRKPPPWSALTASCRRNSSPCRVLHRDEDATEPLSILSLGLCDSHHLADVAGSPPPAVARGRPPPSPSRLLLVLRVSSWYSPLASRAIVFFKSCPESLKRQTPASFLFLRPWRHRSGHCSGRQFPLSPPLFNPDRSLEI